MSGWIEFYDEQITCPFCGQELTAHFIEDYDADNPPTVICGLAGDCLCENCHSIITDADLTSENPTSEQY